MATTTFQVKPNGAISGNTDLADVQVINVEYDPTIDGVTVTPGVVNKGQTVRFQNPQAGKLKIAFLSPEGVEMETISDSDTCTMIVGGVYHFRCYFYLPGGKTVTPKTGGVLEVYPPRP